MWIDPHLISVVRDQIGLARQPRHPKTVICIGGEEREKCFSRVGRVANRHVQLVCRDYIELRIAIFPPILVPCYCHLESIRRAGAYLRLAGGPNRDADRKHIFIIRADGSVISYEAEKGIWGNEFDNLRMNPGDTIVVPEKTFKPSALRGFLDWSQLFSQFALGAAALSVIQ